MQVSMLMIGLKNAFHPLLVVIGMKTRRCTVFVI